ncbi:hypothetical protein [Cellulomonas fengjieae]|uniref:hypothetical protein n=1 Tax=Cellulomonas fengjieae TaxID=2819978 RepID=UPI001FB9B7CF|nr:hypothetical protein [Cellulomonas fengjieae]
MTSSTGGPDQSVPGGSPRGRVSVASRTALVAVLSAACWFAWLGWDTTYQTDPATGVASGPYEAWQVLGCVLSLAAVVALGSLVLGPWWTVLTVTVAFTIAFSVTASSDETGLWGVGALLVAFGVAAGSTVLAMIMKAVASRRRARAA